MIEKKKKKTREEKEKQPGWNAKYDCTDSQLRTRIVADLRKLFRDTRKRVFIREMRIPYDGPKPGGYQVQCLDCECWMTTAEKIRPRNANGSLRAKEIVKYQADHVYGITPMKSFDDLAAFTKDLFEGPLQILCFDCHQIKTKENRKA